MTSGPSVSHFLRERHLIGALFLLIMVNYGALENAVLRKPILKVRVFGDSSLFHRSITDIKISFHHTSVGLSTVTEKIN